MPPSIASRFRRSRRHASAAGPRCRAAAERGTSTATVVTVDMSVAHAGVQPGVQQVHDQVEHHQQALKTITVPRTIV